MADIADEMNTEILRLRAQLREAERLAQIHLRQAWQREDITRAERDRLREEWRKELQGRRHWQGAWRNVLAERDRAKKDLRVALGHDFEAMEAMKELVAERDAAIKRGVWMYRWFQARQHVDRVYVQMIVAAAGREHERAEAAEAVVAAVKTWLERHGGGNVCLLPSILAPVEAQEQIGDMTFELTDMRRERDAAKRAGIAASGKLLEAVLVGDQLARDYDAAIKRGVCAIAYLEAHFELLGTVRQQLIEAMALAHRRLVLLCNVQSHTTVSADIIRMIDEKAEAPVITWDEAQEEGE